MGRKKKVVEPVIEEIITDFEFEDDNEIIDEDIDSDEDISEEELLPEIDENIESLESIKKRFEQIGKKEGVINQEDIFDAVSHLALTDDELENLIQYFKDKKITIE